MDENETYKETSLTTGLVNRDSSNGGGNMKGGEDSANPNNVSREISNSNSNNNSNSTNWGKKYNFNYSNLNISNKKFLLNKNHLYIKAGIKQGGNNSKKIMNKGNGDNVNVNVNVNSNDISNNDKFSDKINTNYNIENSGTENNIYNKQRIEYNYPNISYNHDSENWKNNENGIMFNTRTCTNNNIKNGNNNLTQRKRRTNKFETGNHNYKNKQKKFYNTPITDSLNRYGNNDSNKYSTNIDNINGNEENEQIQDFSNIENNKISNEFNIKQLNSSNINNSNRNLKHLKNSKNLNNKKMFDNISFSIDKYLNSNVNFQKHNNDKNNNSYAKVKNKMTYKNLKIKNKENFNMSNETRIHNSTSNTSNEYVNNHKTNIDNANNANNLNSVNSMVREINEDQVIEDMSKSSNYPDINLLAQTFNYENVKILKTHLEMNINNANPMKKKRNNIYSNIEENKYNSKFCSYIECLSEVSEITDEEKDIEDVDSSEKNYEKNAEKYDEKYDEKNDAKNNNVRWSNNLNNTSEASHSNFSQINLKQFQNDQIMLDKMKGLYSQFGNYNYKNEQVEMFGQNENKKFPYFEENKNQGILENDNISSPHLTRYSSEKKNDSFIEEETEFDKYGMEEINSGNLIEAQQNTSSSNILKNPNNLNNTISSNLIQENEINKFTESTNHIPIEDLFITSYMPYPPEKYNNIYDLHEIKIISPHILKTIIHKKGKTYHSSLKDGKLILLLDLDNTLLQATSFAKFNMDLPLENFIGENDEPELYKFFLPYYNFFYYLKFRPYVRQFLEILSLYYELSIYTNATREYADVVIAILDPDRTIFADRIVARCSSVDRDENKHFEKIYPNVDPKYVIAFDDRKDVWFDIPHSHILRAEHYNFFELSKYDIISHFKEPSTCKKRFVDMDMHLHYMIKIFLKIHKQFFENPLNVDVGKIIDNIMLSTLSNVGLYFTGFRKNSKNLQNVILSDCEERQKEIALELGAKIYSNYDDPGVTHIIAAKNCTDNLIKSKQSNYNHIEKVHTLWLYHCKGTLQNIKSSLFNADELCKIYNNKPPLHPKKDHWFFGNKDAEKKQDNQNDCIKVENLKSRIFLGTGEYTNDAVICSPYEQINIKWIEKEVKLRQIYDNVSNTVTQDQIIDHRLVEKRNNDETEKNIRNSNFVLASDLDISDKVIQNDKQ
ncbi:NLI interacting factor-like phosphatase, putative [Plasmodium yoelii]|uniref:protein-serine/threonine phosphatase n=3 Tax=Plasmodium yoelii TaxID=5861 RepID=A0AAE9WUD2_PLAYO|nr:NLI interacting factor-like phosphatase, putative [Plasmodium yoelii]EAA16594.1 NLI interacting factor, putative [Plasmodium yoelii yoelii]WBY58745.1 NLI interacting factor-like phosphatase [Plasmodium yoelii yoelii]CDU19022.1 protein phosphatase, putative [Plasmodium yoelii]VTZ79607.1 NLI interacting factor-like phosphatase, putative [Plasmodium yoelii]|eukprot:XP_725029.1 NLI interacting factor-like phosphatase, putative [Plasmodium yoelii]